MAFEVTADPAATAYATLDQANDAAEVRVGGSAFIDADDEQQEQWLNSASLALDTLDWKGARATTTQELDWPRTGTDYSDDAIPGKLVDATIALAWYYADQLAADATADVANPDTRLVKRKKTGPLETEYFEPGTTTTDESVGTFPLHVRNLVRSLVRSTRLLGYGSASVTRGS